MPEPHADDLRPGRAGEARHPPVAGIEDVISFRMQQLVGLGERAGGNWTRAGFDLSPQGWRLLALVAARQPVRVSGLASILLMDKSQLSRLVKQMTQAGLMRAVPDQEDGRAVKLSLSLRGRRLHDRMLAELLGWNERMLAPLSAEEITLLQDMLGRLIAHLGAADTEAPEGIGPG